MTFLNILQMTVMASISICPELSLGCVVTGMSHNRIAEFTGHVCLITRDSSLVSHLGSRAQKPKNDAQIGQVLFV
ncbi:hypothetical protein F5Y14DRAFT_394963 [Nemania sp. NC0429]|nr:hypothetical protein F5Y14DRAFT_394963 [Nemania sp. NC0429]